eukprot:Tamp_36708.p2 GENE.Tamp_36708~~Tamp_36708.p2  ORF type:complete len:111 (-),score=9.82 Tamp_36708:91-423(-)
MAKNPLSALKVASPQKVLFAMPVFQSPILVALLLTVNLNTRTHRVRRKRECSRFACNHRIISAIKNHESRRQHEAPVERRNVRHEHGLSGLAGKEGRGEHKGAAAILHFA